MTFWPLLWAAMLMLGATVVARTVADDLYHREGMQTVVLMLGVVTLVLTIVCGVGFVAANLDRASCLEGGENAGTTVHYELLSGCYVKVDGRFIPYDRWVQATGANAP